MIVCQGVLPTTHAWVPICCLHLSRDCRLVTMMFNDRAQRLSYDNYVTVINALCFQ